MKWRAMVSDNKLLILSIGRDIVTGAESQLGRKADAIVRRTAVDPADFPEIRREVYTLLKQWQGGSITLILSGPLALAFTLGQLIGLNHFDIRLLHYNADQHCYQQVNAPGRSEIA